MARSGGFALRMMVLAGSTLVFAGHARAQEAQPAISRLTLAEAVAAARVNNGRLRDADEAVEQARISRNLARSAFRPKVAPNVLGAIGQPDLSSQSYGMNVSQRFTTGTALDASVGTSALRDQLGTFYYTDTTFVVTQPLFGGPGREGTRRQLTAAEDDVNATGAQRQLTEQRLVVDVASAYYAIVAQQQMLGVAEKGRERCARLLDVSRAKLAIGKVSQLDVLRAAQLLADAEERVFDASEAAEDARDDLRLLMGRSDGAPFDVDADIPVSREPLDVEAAVRTAVARRPDLRSARDAAEHAARSEHATRAQLPEVDVKLALTRRDTAQGIRSSFGLDGFRLVPFAAISMPIDRPGERETAVLRAQRARDAVDRLQAQIEIDVRRAVRQAQRLEHALASADAAVHLATVQADVAAERFQRGLSNNLDLIGAETDLLGARGRRVEAAAAVAVARLNLQATLGILDGPSQ
jgi:outer membrane protein